MKGMSILRFFIFFIIPTYLLGLLLGGIGGYLLTIGAQVADFFPTQKQYDMITPLFIAIGGVMSTVASVKGAIAFYKLEKIKKEHP